MLTRREIFDIAMSDRARWDGNENIGLEESLTKELDDDEQIQVLTFMVSLSYEVWYRIKYGQWPPGAYRAG